MSRRLREAHQKDCGAHREPARPPLQGMQSRLAGQMAVVVVLADVDRAEAGALPLGVHFPKPSNREVNSQERSREWLETVPPAGASGFPRDDGPESWVGKRKLRGPAVNVARSESS